MVLAEHHEPRPRSLKRALLERAGAETTDLEGVQAEDVETKSRARAALAWSTDPDS